MTGSAQPISLQKNACMISLVTMLSLHKAQTIAEQKFQAYFFCYS